jgi:hypothetical protein
MKIYIHHYFDKSLLYTLANNTTDRKYFIENNVGSVFCKYKNTDIEFIFKQEISFEDDGHHILDYFSAYFNSDSDSKIGPILPDRSYMDRENQQILKIFINLLKDCPKNQKWLITYFRTEKILHSIDAPNGHVNEKIKEIESLLKQLNNHYIINDNPFLDKKIESLYPNFHFAFTNSIFQWNANLNVRWYFEFKSIFEKLNFDYDLMYSVRNHKMFRINLINELSKLKNDRIYLQTSDTLKHNKYYKKYGYLVSEDVKCSSIYGQSDFADISYIENTINGLDLFFRVLPKAKMQILCESWSESKQDFASQYLSEKTIGMILAGIPFISTHDYPLTIIQTILEIDNHPFYEESKKYKSDAKLFAEFVDEFMKNFEENYKLCKEWSDLAFEKFIHKIENENSLLDLIFNGDLIKNNTIKKKIL